MFDRIVAAAQQLPLLVVGLVVGLITLGAVQLREMPVDTLPQFSPVYVEVQTESLGLSAVEVEQLITAPMEQMLLNGVPWLEEITSESVPGLSSIVLVFEAGTDPLEARQVVQERLAQGRDLPKVAKAPVMLQPLSSTSRVMMVRVDSDELSPIEQSLLAKWTLKPALQGVPGVANVAIWGHREQQMQVQVDARRLARHGVTLRDVVTTSANSLWVSPLSFVEASTPGTGGFIDTPNQRLSVHHVLPINDPRDFDSVPLERADGEPVRGPDGEPMKLGDVVTVVQDHQPLIGDAVAGESQGLMLVVEKFPEANALEVTEGIEATLAELAPGLEGLEITTDVYRPATYLESALQTVTWVLVIGGALALLVIGLLQGWRAAVVAGVALPLSLVAAALVLDLRGETMNLMLAMGLVAAAAVVVDDVTADHHAVRRELARAPVGPSVQSSWRRSAVVAGIAGTRRPILVAGLVTVAATAPIAVVGIRLGMDAALFVPVLVSLLLALIASFLVALVVTPVIRTLLLSRRGTVEPLTRAAEGLERRYSAVLRRVSVKPLRVAAGFGVVALAGVLVVPLLDADMRPQLAERTVLVTWEAAPGTSQTEMSRITARVADELRGVSGVADVGAHIGRALTSDRVVDVNSGELWAALEPDADHDDTMADLRAVVAGYPGIDHEVLTYTDERTEAQGIGEAESDDVVVRIYGQEYDVLAAKAEEVRAALDERPGTVAVELETEPEQAQLDVRVDLAAARSSGLTPGQVRRAAATLVSGIEVGNLFEEQKVFEVVVLGTPAVRHDVTELEGLLIDTPNGGQVRLGDVAELQILPAHTTIEHEAVSRYIDVVAEVEGRSSADVAADADEVVADVAFPLEYHAEVVGDHADARAALVRDFGIAVGALGLVLLLLQAYLQSWKLALVGLVGLPPALAGCLLVVAAGEAVVGLGVLVGLIVVTAVYSRLALTLLGRYRSLLGAVPGRSGGVFAQTGAEQRVVPAVSTCLGVAALVIPAAVTGERPGLELLQPMAATVLGGLVTTAAVALLGLPVWFSRLTPDLDAPVIDDSPTPARDSRSETAMAFGASDPRSRDVREHDESR